MPARVIAAHSAIWADLLKMKFWEYSGFFLDPDLFFCLIARTLLTWICRISIIISQQFVNTVMVNKFYLPIQMQQTSVAEHNLKVLSTKEVFVYLNSDGGVVCLERYAAGFIDIRIISLKIFHN